MLEPQMLAEHPIPTKLGDNSNISSEHTVDPAAGLVARLCRLLAEEGIVYCHWKSNDALDRSASGKNDLDLLVSQADMLRFSEIVFKLGFKPALAAAQKEMPGVLDYFGYDVEVDQLIHVHAHYQLIVGHDMTKNFRIPIEEPYLASAVQGNLFKVPGAGYEFVVFVLRMIFKHATWDVLLAGQGRLNGAERREFAELLERSSPDDVNAIVQQHLPLVGVELFNKCVHALDPACPMWLRMRTGQQLQGRLEAHARRPLPVDVWLKFWRRGVLAVRRRTKGAIPKYRLARGGVLIAIVGGDGAGKSTAIEGVYEWLAKTFDTSQTHMGKPEWSLATRMLRSVLKLGNMLGLYPPESTYRETVTEKSLVSVGYPWLLREVCRARDRYRTYVQARRFALAGGLVILDRYPVPQIHSMDGPLAERFLHDLTVTTGQTQGGQWMTPRRASRFSEALIRREKRYYERIVPPDVLIVLRVDPEIAVQRKTDEDSAAVRARSTEIWEIDWTGTDAYVLDGAQPKAAVQAELRALIWSEL